MMNKYKHIKEDLRLIQILSKHPIHNIIIIFQ